MTHSPATDAPPAPTNVQIGALIGMGYTGISRIRTGDRHPSIEAMRRIERALEWPCSDQIEWRERGKYAEEFERRAAQRVSELVDSDTPASP